LAHEVDLVIVPAWQRPDFLTATLRRLDIAVDHYHGDVRYLIAVDRRADPKVGAIATRFARRHAGHVRVVHRSHTYRGNSYNVLTAYREACDHDADLVHLIEEDIFVAHDYFAYARQAHNLCPDVFAVSACRNQNLREGPSANATAVYRYPKYQSLAVSFRPGQLRRILKHAHPGYFQDPVRYCTETFPSSTLGRGFAEQDGLIDRIIEAEGLQVAYPAVPRAYHAGFHSYNRGGQPLPGPVEDRARTLLAMTADELNTRAVAYPDFTVTPLDEQRPPIQRIITWPRQPRWQP
jgi:hypothetical protein